jgi:periplasmic protein TonB
MKPIEEKEEQFNEIIFENRNKEYGAYALRASYKKRMLIALSVSLTAFLLAVSFPLIAAYLNKTHNFVEYKTVDAELYNPNNKTEATPPPPPPPPPTDPVANKRFVAPTVVGIDSVETNFSTDIDSVKNEPVPLKEEIISTEIKPDVKKESIIDNKVYDLIDIQEFPSFPGGDEEWMNFIVQNIQYPRMAIESGTSGTVFLKFVIEPDGSISNVSSIRPLGFGCDEEAVRVLKMLKKWNPGKQNGKAVRVWFTLPIKFTLQ